MAKVIAVILGLSAAACLTQPKIALRKGSGRFGIVNFPGVWLSHPPEGLSGAEKYKVRIIPRDGKEYIIFKAVTANGIVSSNQYLVSLTSDAVAVSASDEEWKTAKEVGQFQGSRLEDPNLIEAYGHAGPSDPPAPEYFKYSGVSYPRSGKIWGNYYAETPPNKDWLMLSSYSVEEYRQGLWGEVKAPYRGKNYFDMYKVKPAGAGIASAEAQVACTFHGGRVTYGTLWVEDRYLIIPVDISMSSCIIWEIPK